MTVMFSICFFFPEKLLSSVLISSSDVTKCFPEPTGACACTDAAAGRKMSETLLLANTIYIVVFIFLLFIAHLKEPN